MRWFYDVRYTYGRGLPLRPQDVHGFLVDKATRIRDGLVAGGVPRDAFVSPEPVPESALASVHDSSVRGALASAAAIAEAIEFPALAALPAALVRGAVLEPQLRAAGGTVAALASAACGEWAINLSGGFHHARPDLVHGFCLVNDVALAVARLREAGGEEKVLVLDLDLHQGDGNAAMFAGDSSVYTVSMHEEAVFPVPKLSSDHDVGLPSGAGDGVYLDALEAVVEHVDGAFRPDVIIHVAGTDPFEADPLGTLQLSAEGLLARDRRVARFARDLGAGLVVLPAGGYSSFSPALAVEGFLATCDEAPNRA